MHLGAILLNSSDDDRLYISATSLDSQPIVAAHCVLQSDPLQIARHHSLFPVDAWYKTLDLAMARRPGHVYRSYCEMRGDAGRAPSDARIRQTEQGYTERRQPAIVA